VISKTGFYNPSIKHTVVNEKEDSLMMMSVTASVFAGNNRSVALMQQGRFDEAMCSLRTAHERLKVLLKLQNALLTPPVSPPVKSQSHHHIPIYSTPLKEHPTTASHSASCTALEHVFALFNRAFLFPETLEEDLDFSCRKVQS
jgi:hypothetical protein